MKRSKFKLGNRIVNMENLPNHSIFLKFESAIVHPYEVRSFFIDSKQYLSTIVDGKL